MPAPLDRYFTKKKVMNIFIAVVYHQRGKGGEKRMQRVTAAEIQLEGEIQDLQPVL